MALDTRFPAGMTHFFCFSCQSSSLIQVLNQLFIFTYINTILSLWIISESSA